MLTETVCQGESEILTASLLLIRIVLFLIYPPHTHEPVTGATLQTSNACSFSNAIMKQLSLLLHTHIYTTPQHTHTFVLCFYARNSTDVLCMSYQQRTNAAIIIIIITHTHTHIPHHNTTPHTHTHTHTHTHLFYAGNSTDILCMSYQPVPLPLWVLFMVSVSCWCNGFFCVNQTPFKMSWCWKMAQLLASARSISCWFFSVWFNMHSRMWQI